LILQVPVKSICLE